MSILEWDLAWRGSPPVSDVGRWDCARLPWCTVLFGELTCWRLAQQHSEPQRREQDRDHRVDDVEEAERHEADSGHAKGRRLVGDAAVPGDQRRPPHDRLHRRSEETTSELQS